MNFNGFKDWLMLALLAAGVSIFWDMNRGVQQLHITMATIVEKVVTHDRRLDRHEVDIDRLKSRPE